MFVYLRLGDPICTVCCVSLFITSVVLRFRCLRRGLYNDSGGKLIAFNLYTETNVHQGPVSVPSVTNTLSVLLFEERGGGGTVRSKTTGVEPCAGG